MGEVQASFLRRSGMKTISLETDEKRDTYVCFLFDRFYSGEINVVLLNDARIQRVEIHDENELVPETSVRLEHKTAFIFVSFAFLLAASTDTMLVLFRFFFHGRPFPVCFVWTDIFESVEFVKQDIFVAFSTTPIQCLVPGSKKLSLEHFWLVMCHRTMNCQQGWSIAL